MARVEMPRKKKLTKGNAQFEFCCGEAKGSSDTYDQCLAYFKQELEDIKIGHHFDKQPTFKMINEFNDRIDQLIKRMEE